MVGERATCPQTGDTASRGTCASPHRAGGRIWPAGLVLLPPRQLMVTRVPPAGGARLTPIPDRSHNLGEPGPDGLIRAATRRYCLWHYTHIPYHYTGNHRSCCTGGSRWIRNGKILQCNLSGHTLHLCTSRHWPPGKFGLQR